MDGKEIAPRRKSDEHVARAERITNLNRKTDQKIEQRRNDENELGPPYPEANARRNVR
jgi:hypothetical protein